MLRLIHIEWLKVRYNVSFWLLLGLYAVGVFSVCSLGEMLMQATVITSGSGDGLGNSPMINIYEFPNIWHNLTYLGSFLKILLGIIIVVSISNEFNYRTLRQNIIDGMSRYEFLLSKFSHSFFVSLFATLLIVLLVIYFGSKYSESGSGISFGEKSEFAIAYFFQCLAYMSLATLLAMLIRSAGLAIVFLIVYTLFMESMISWIILPADSGLDMLLPVSSLDSLISSPLNIFDPSAVQESIATQQFVVVLGWLATSSLLSYYILFKKDL